METNIRNSLINIEQANIKIDNALWTGLILGSLVTATLFLVNLANSSTNDQS